MKRIMAMLFVGVFVFSGVASADLMNGLVAYYAFENNLVDLSGSGNSGTENGTIGYSQGVIGEAAVFNGSSFINLPEQSVSDILSDTWTISFWAISNGTPDVPSFGFANSGSVNLANPLASYGNQNATVSIGDGTSWQLLDPLPSATSASWTFYSILDDGTNYSIYANNQLVDIEAISVNPGAASDRTLLIGQSGFGSPAYNVDLFVGMYDDFRIYNRALDSTELNELYELGNPVPEPTTMLLIGTGLIGLAGLKRKTGTS